VLVSDKMSSAVSSAWVIDAVEAGWARLSPTPSAEALGLTQSFTLPALLLPQGAREGDVVSLSLSLEAAQGETLKQGLKERVSALTSEDDGGDFSL
jgi:hypothetical protein